MPLLSALLSERLFRRPQSTQRPDDGVKLLVIPQPGEVEADGGGREMCAFARGGDEPLDAGQHVLARTTQSVQSDGCFFDARRRAGVATKGAVSFLGAAQVLAAALDQAIGQGGKLLAATEMIDHLRRTIDRIVFIRRVLVAKPQRNPGAICQLHPLQIGERMLGGLGDAALQCWRHLVMPHPPRAQGMRRDLRRAAIKRQRTPATAKRGNATIAILQIKQPCNALLNRPIIGMLDLFQRNERTRSVICIRHTTGQIRPRPPTRRRIRERMHLTVLLMQTLATMSTLIVRATLVSLCVLVTRVLL